MGLIRSTPGAKKNFIFFFGSLLLLILGGFAAYQLLTRSIPSPLPDLSVDATVSADKIKHTSVKNGVTEWRIEADHANYFKSGSIVNLENFTVTFFTSSGEPIITRAKHGKLNTASGNIQATENVSVLFRSHTLKTKQLRYDSGRKRIISDTPVAITGPKLATNAAKLTYDIATDTLKLAGNVEGTIFELETP